MRHEWVILAEPARLALRMEVSALLSRNHFGSSKPCLPDVRLPRMPARRLERGLLVLLVLI
jgi:hypothetical protein